MVRWFGLARLIDAAAAADMLAWKNSRFSVDASVWITLLDRDVPSYFQSLEHLLRYCARAGGRGSYRERMFAIAPMAAHVGKWLQSFLEFPPRQKPGSFNFDWVMEAVTAGSGSGR